MKVIIDKFDFKTKTLYQRDFKNTKALTSITIKDGFKYCSQQFDGKILHLVKQRGLYPYEYTSSIENSDKRLLNEEQFIT